MDEVQPSQVLGGIAEKNKKKKMGTQVSYSASSVPKLVLANVWELTFMQSVRAC